MSDKRTFNGSRQAAALPIPAGPSYIEYSHASVPCFRVRVHPSGRRQWVFRMKTEVLEPGGARKTKDVRDAFADVPTGKDVAPGQLTYEAALAEATTRRQRLIAANAAPTGKRRLTVKEAWQLHTSDPSVRRGATLKKEQGEYSRYLSRFDDRFLDELDNTDVLAFTNALRSGTLNPGKKPLAAETVRGILNCLALLYQTARTHEGLGDRPKDWNPAELAKHRLPAPIKRRGYLPTSSLRRVWLAADIVCASWARDQLKLYILTGLRHALLAELTFEEIDFAASCLLISPHKPGTKRRARSTPVNADHLRLPISRTALEILRARREFAPNLAGPVWYLEYPVGGRGAQTAQMHRDPRSNFERVRAFADTVRFTPHDLRRTFATLGVTCADLAGVSLLLLHSPATLSQVAGIPGITGDYMNTQEAQDRMRVASAAVEARVLEIVRGEVRPVHDVELPPEIEAALGPADDRAAAHEEAVGAVA